MKINTKTVITVTEAEVQALLLEHITIVTGLESVPQITWQDGQVILEYTESPTKEKPVEKDEPPFVVASTEEPTVEEKLKKIKDAEGITKQPSFTAASSNLFSIQ